jgi:exonuclease SbcC
MLDRVLAALEELARKRQELADITTEIATIENEQSRLQKEGAAKRTLINELQTETGQECPMCQQPLTPEHRDTVVSQLQAEGDEINAQFAENRSQLASLREREGALRKELERQAALEKERDARQAAVGRAESRLEDIDRFLATWAEDGLQTKIAQLEASLADDAEERELRALLESLKSAADESRQLNQQIKQLEGQIARDETRLEELTRLRRQWEEDDSPALALVHEQLATNDYAQIERAALAKVVVRLEAVGYDVAAHTAARARRDQLAPSAGEHQQLQQAEAAVKPLTDALDDLERRREAILTRLVDLRARCEETTRMLQELEAGVGDLRAAEAELNRLRELVAQANRTTGAARQKVDVLQVRHEDKTRLNTERSQIAHRVSLLRQLEEACGRKGVQAMLIERALPEIEDYANDLLATLTNGEMRIRFDTQRSKKKDDAQIETLDIVISDSAGSRPYENYSGGEQFRVNFAIRLALSQMLARRAGARLRTLVIDEGFGSQDPEGRQRLVEAINAVQSKFACILVITHVDELRDKFPARIDVERTPAGSRLSVVTI